jgi:hypothetical protein
MPISISLGERSLLLKCPHEIRQLIYRHIIPTEETLLFTLVRNEEDHFVTERGSEFPRFDASILGACRLLHEECTELLSKANTFELSISPHLAQPSSRCYRLFYRQLTKVRRCYVKIRFKLEYGSETRFYVYDVSEGALQVRQLVHRLVDCLEQTRLESLHLTIDSQRKWPPNSPSPTPAPTSAPQVTPIVVARCAFLYRAFQHVLDMFLKLQYVEQVNVSGNLFEKNYQAWLKAKFRLKAAGKALRWSRKGLSPSQKFWRDRSGVFNHISKHREQVGGKTRTWAIQLGPLRRSQRSV